MKITISATPVYLTQKKFKSRHVGKIFFGESQIKTEIFDSSDFARYTKSTSFQSIAPVLNLLSSMVSSVIITCGSKWKRHRINLIVAKPDIIKLKILTHIPTNATKSHKVYEEKILRALKTNRKTHYPKQNLRQ